MQSLTKKRLVLSNIVTMQWNYAPVAHLNLLYSLYSGSNYSNSITTIFSTHAVYLSDISFRIK